MYNWYLNNDDINDMKRYQNIVIDRINEEILRVVELVPNDGHKSFYGRCKVIETRSRVYLLSYSTMVCYWDNNNKKFSKLWNDYSATTMRHINSFMIWLGFPGLGGKKWWESLSYGFEYTISELVNII